LLATAFFMAALAGAGVLQGARPASADSIISYSTRQLEDGATGYTTTQYSDAVLVQDFGHVRFQGKAAVSGTGTMTVTPQFSLEPLGCGSVTAWFSGTAFAVTAGYYTGTVFVTEGRCLRLQYTNPTSVTRYTPTVYIQSLSTYD